MNSDRVPVLARFREIPGLRQLSSTLMALGVLLLLVGISYAAHQLLSQWLAGKDRHLAVRAAIVSIPSAASPTSNEPSTLPAMPAITPISKATPEASPMPGPYRAVRLRIPALNINRSIVNLPRIEDARTGAWTRNVESLFRPGRKDLVGHWEGSAYPGQEGNMILVGHNYGQGFNGVFQRLGRLQVGQKVYVTDEAGQTFTYRVTTVQQLKWKEKHSQELATHWKYLSPDGPERLTLVTCAGAQFEPFPQRIYVVAEPVQ